MRCTEGVWLSATPTKDALIVAMDFEGKFNNNSSSYLEPYIPAGVHSLERSAQEGSRHLIPLGQVIHCSTQMRCLYFSMLLYQTWSVRHVEAKLLSICSH